MAEKFELASQAWFDEVFRLFAKVAGENPDLSFSVCEVFTKVPSRLGPDGDGRKAWHAFIRDGRSEAAMGEVAGSKVDVKTIAEWEAVLPAARARIDLTPEGLARYQQLSAQAVADGRIQRSGDTTKAPPALVAVHNALADLTL